MKFDYDRICDFDNLYRAYIVSRRNKRTTREVVQFELNPGPNICRLRDALVNGTYKLSGYYHFTIHDPKVREIYALNYADRIVQHSLCDNVLAPYFENHLVYDNSACRVGKGTLFAINRLSGFLRKFFRENGLNGYFLKCDVHKFFDSIDHKLLKDRLKAIVDDGRTYRLLCHIIDSYEVTPGKGIPMGNQTSQWFALFYLDPLDRLVKEQYRIRFYTRYMDDCILIDHSREKLGEIIKEMRVLAESLGLEFNEKTQIFPISHGVEYLGWRHYLTETGAVVRRLKKHSKTRWLHRLRKLKKEYADFEIDYDKVSESLQSYRNHLSYGNTWHLHSSIVQNTVFRREPNNQQEDSH